MGLALIGVMCLIGVPFAIWAITSDKKMKKTTHLDDDVRTAVFGSDEVNKATRRNSNE